MLKSLHIAGTTPLHHLPARAKLVSLFVASLVIFALGSLWLLGAALVLSCAVFASLRMSFRESRARIGWMMVSIGIVAAITALVQSPEAGLAAFLRFTCLILLASAVTATTEIGDFMAEITWAMAPLERLGLVRAADVGLALGLVLRFVPDILSRYEEMREAHKARGLPARPLRLIAPVIILTLKDADMIAMAIDARGLRRQ